MKHALLLVGAATGLWGLGAVWVYDCKIKRVCGPSSTVSAPPAAAPAAVLSTPVAPAPAAEAAPTSVPAADPLPTAAVPPPATGVVLTVSFDARSSALLPPADAEARLTLLRSGIAQGLKIRVLGHSDGRGARERIAIVSQQRAESLRDWLLAQGIPPSAIVAVESREDRDPIASNHRDEGRRLNRRAEAVLTQE